MDNVASWILLYLVLPIALGILGNLITPWIKSYVDRGSLTIQERRYYILNRQYHYIKSLRENPDRLNLLVFRNITIGILGLVGLVGIIGVLATLSLASILYGGIFFTEPMYMIAYFGMLLVMYIAAYRLNSLLTTLDRLWNFDKYEKKTLDKLDKFMGAPKIFREE